MASGVSGPRGRRKDGVRPSARAAGPRRHPGSSSAPSMSTPSFFSESTGRSTHPEDASGASAKAAGSGSWEGSPDAVVLQVGPPGREGHGTVEADPQGRVDAQRWQRQILKGRESFRIRA